ncbi:MAG: hypothetical protein ACLRMZ_00490 [Blautia marasmi]
MRKKIEIRLNIAKEIIERMEASGDVLEEVIREISDVPGAETENRLTIEELEDSSNQLIKFGSLNADIYVGCSRV